METVDEVAGLPLRYTSKLFAPFPIKTLGKVSLGPILGALCCRIDLIEDHEMLERIGHRIISTRKNARERMPAKRRGHVLKNSDLARLLQRRWVLQTSPQQRRRWATQGAQARWQKPRRGK